jgi:hypothetical protein
MGVTVDLPDKALQCNVAQLRELRDQVLLLCQDPQGLHILSHMVLFLCVTDDYSVTAIADLLFC